MINNNLHLIQCSHRKRSEIHLVGWIDNIIIILYKNCVRIAGLCRALSGRDQRRWSFWRNKHPDSIQSPDPDISMEIWTTHINGSLAFVVANSAIKSLDATSLSINWRVTHMSVLQHGSAHRFEYLFFYFEKHPSLASPDRSECHPENKHFKSCLLVILRTDSFVWKQLFSPNFPLENIAPAIHTAIFSS